MGGFIGVMISLSFVLEFYWSYIEVNGCKFGDGDGESM